MTKNLHRMKEYKVKLSLLVEAQSTSATVKIISGGLCLYESKGEITNGNVDIPMKLVPEYCSVDRTSGDFVNIQLKSVPFLGDYRYWANFVADTSTTGGRRQQFLHVSHTCHNATCLNFVHCCQEWDTRNQGRPGCPACDLCRHHPWCLMIGEAIY